MSDLPVSTPVHYVSYGTPGGEYQSECRAALLTERPRKVPASAQVSASLAVLNPGGLFFDRDCHHSQTPRGGTWHTIEECTS